MAKAKKDAAYLNVYIERTMLERLNKFCDEIGGNKSVTTAPPADLKNIKSVNTLVVAEGCRDDACVEPSKKRIGWGSYAGATAIERIKQGKSKHFNTYKCDRFEECRGKCGIYTTV